MNIQTNGFHAFGMASAILWASAWPSPGQEPIPPQLPSPENLKAPAQRKTQTIPMRITWGHRSPASTWQVRLLATNLALSELVSASFEPTDRLEPGGCATTSGKGDIDGLAFTVTLSNLSDPPLKPHQIWQHLLDHSDTDTVKRLQGNRGFRPDSRKLTVQLGLEGARGFSLTADQLLAQKAFWIPELDIYVAVGKDAPSWDEHQRTLEAKSGQRVLHALERAPEATYAQHVALWDDMGSPHYKNPHSVGPGHVVCLAWDGSLQKFGVDRGGNVWNDYGNPDHFHLGWTFGDLNNDLASAWKGQSLEQGLPVITTTIERDGVRCRIEQFACPLGDPPRERRGDIPMVLMEKLTVQEVEGNARQWPARLSLRRELPRNPDAMIIATNGAFSALMNGAANEAWLTFQGDGFTLNSNATTVGKWTTYHLDFIVDLPALGTRELIVTLPSSPAPAEQHGALHKLDFDAARARTLGYWADYLHRGAQFDVPDPAVNTLFRASLWHALRLPRRHGGDHPGVKIDLPYSNFAYDQHGTPWPVNQAVYVDYMLYDLRGYHPIAAEELAAMFRNNQETNGHVGGFANWGVYTPGMVYAVAQHYLLSGDRASLDRLLPQTLKALDWCLAEMRKAFQRTGPHAGLVLAPLNDLTHDPKAWAFNQAYLFAGTDLMGRVLEEIGHSRAPECRAMARKFFEAIQRGFGYASMQSPLVPLRDGTWIPYVPGDALTPRRLLEVWYPTDVDCGPLHLSRLKALDPRGELTTFLLHDHEDNLFFKQLGMANEPVYNQHATALLLRDQPAPVIRSFYSMLACAFSHSVFESVEHRWGWGQYFCPPSTDGAWFDLYRHMLINEQDDGSLWLCQAAPRRWFENSKRISVTRAPTFYGPITMTTQSRSALDEISAQVKMPRRKTPETLVVRLRHPAAKQIRSVQVNGREWPGFDPRLETIRIPRPIEVEYNIVARY